MKSSPIKTMVFSKVLKMHFPHIGNWTISFDPNWNEDERQINSFLRLNFFYRIAPWYIIVSKATSIEAVTTVIYDRNVQLYSPMKTAIY
jgi:hypothetical protein